MKQTNPNSTEKSITYETEKMVQPKKIIIWISKTLSTTNQSTVVALTIAGKSGKEKINGNKQNLDACLKKEKV